MGAPKGGGPKISRFFPPLPPQFSFFLLSLGGRGGEILVVFEEGGVPKGGGHKCARLEFSGCRVKPRPGGPKAAGA